MPGGDDQQEQTTRTEPWEAQQPFLRRLFREARQQLDRPAEETLAGFTPLQQQGRQAAERVAGQAQGNIGDVSDQAVGALEQAITGTSGPGLAEMVDAATRPAQRQFSEQTMPQIRRNAVQSGNIGGSRQGVAEGIAARGLQDTIADTSVQVQNEQQRRALQAAGMAPGLERAQFGLQLMPADIMRQLGGEEQSQEQALLDAQNRQLQQYQQLIGGNYGQTTTQPGPTSNPFLSAIGGAAGGAGLGGMLSAEGAALSGNPWAVPIAAGVGGLGGLLGG